MREKNKIYFIFAFNFTFILVTCLCISISAYAQSGAYKQKKKEKVITSSEKPAAKVEEKKESEKLDIQDLEQKYWAPKDTDFSVVQNRTYTKAKRVAVSLLAGPVINDPFNDGITTALEVNYYLDERYGIELMFQQSSFSDSDATDNFKELSGGGTRPDFNRDKKFYGAGFNWVPFYAKMSFLGKKIIYFDMQVTPFIGITTYQQLSTVKSPEQTAFAYGLDITQYFFFSEHWAFRANLHNRFFKADVLAYTGANEGKVIRSGESTKSTDFLLGFTYFF
ncbi:MAG: hypothetical protein A2Z20_11605 [Bdellovibrionales bacterium RBG_16_40_8]|nr:MAG: hypothetical protein A2Z20_11605 [Bdellovibrionales bacterium RBG_16_40_8]